MKRIESHIIRIYRGIRRGLATLVFGGMITSALMAGDRGEELFMERWMAAPFIHEMNAAGAWTETGTCLESWMTMPFGNDLIDVFKEENAVLESWMTMPFGNDLIDVLQEENAVLESWMTVPFTNGFPQEDPTS